MGAINAVIYLIKAAIKIGIKDTEITVLSNYRARIDFYLVILRQEKLKVEAATVDGYRGRANHYIIFDHVRTKAEGDTNRPGNHTTAYTRAKSGLAIIVNGKKMVPSTATACLSKPNPAEGSRLLSEAVSVR